MPAVNLYFFSQKRIIPYIINGIPPAGTEKIIDNPYLII